MTIFTLPGRQRKVSALVSVRLRLINIPQIRPQTEYFKILPKEERSVFRRGSEKLYRIYECSDKS